MTANNKLAGWFAVAVALVALMVTVSFWSFQQIEQTAHARQGNNAMLAGANKLLGALVDAETSQRGFLLTGEESFLERYFGVRDQVPVYFEALRPAIGPAQKHLDALAPLIDAKMKYFERNVELRRANDGAAAVENMRGPGGKLAMDLIRAELQALMDAVEDERATRDAEFASSMKRLFILLVGASGITLLAALAFVWLFRRELAQRVQNEVHLMTRHELEVIEANSEQLKQAIGTLAATINSVGDAVIATDAEARVTLINPLAETLTGWSRADALGRPLEEVFRTIDEQTRLAIAGPVMDTAEHGPQGAANQAVLISKQGTECPIADSLASIREPGGKVLGAVLVFRDITERRRLDAALRDQNARLEKADRAKSEFLSSMSHELRSPLNAILGFAQLMETDAPPPTASQALSIGQILEAGWHLLNLINEILDLETIESGQVPVVLEPVSLAEMLVECLAMVGPAAKLRGVQLAIAEGTAPFVSADRTRLKQVLINLLSNAIKYNALNGTVTVSYSRPTTALVRISIADTGDGLSADQVSHLFQAFNRLGQEGRGIEGTGIGLVVVKRLVELMGGTIGVDSAVGAGSVFWFELVAVEVERLAETGHTPTDHTPPLDLPAAQVRTVLYVEDNAANLMLVEQIIERLPTLRLITATDGYQGIELARAARPDVILMDINLPGIGGVEAMQILRSDPTTAKIPVLALSANAMPHDVERALALGFFRYITKPIKVNDFIQSLTLALAEHPARARPDQWQAK